MGHHAKYLTKDDKDLAARERKQSYAKSAHGKAVRSEQNRRAYQKQRQQAIHDPPLPPLILPTLPNLLIVHAEEPLPLHSEYYQQELRAHGDIHDEDVYTYWDNPPYQNPAHHIDSRGLVVFCEAMIGRRRRLQ
ncbi:hypothetical protein BDN70DRAFT_938857 [Pholiota conissans]|uniref:Uncharacterized protein n=1 Tax=Pholiota conissans TaxID=109636 RepID=A0A9P5YMI5_9AGAR|nr:hypothetical protein BDN70DRAFT_938857 [Pholiota conissans]